MAIFHPSRCPSGIHDSEHKVWKSLEQLDDEWHVFHSVTWQSVRNGRQGDGEADFILLHPRHGIVVLEVKGGGIDLVDGAWRSTDRYGRTHDIKNPFLQATESKHALLRYLQAIQDLGKVPRIGHAIALPDFPMSETSIGMHPREIVLDATDLTDSSTAVNRIVAHWKHKESATLSKRDLRKIIRLLAPTMQARRMMGRSVAESEVELIDLTERQMDILRMLRLVRRCAIAGGAGTGKTLLAVEKARTFAEEGARTLFLCFNRPLCDWIRSSLAGNQLLTISTFHSLCLGLARKIGAELPRELNDTWFDERAAEILVDAAGELTESEKFDALVIDETQDFEEGWLTAAQLLLRDPDDSPLVAFFDNHQQLYRKGLELPSEWTSIPLDRNCRNALPIAQLVARCFGDEIPKEGANGPAPSYVEATDLDGTEILQEVVYRLLVEEGLTPDKIVVLTRSRHTADRLRNLSAGPSAFVALGKTGVVVETIHRYKGLESSVIVLYLDGRLNDTAEEVRTLAYVGASRARGALVIVGSKEWLDWFRDLRRGPV